MALVLAAAGRHLRDLVPEQYHQAAWLTGMILFCLSFLAAALMRRSSPAEQRRLENCLLTGAAIGALLFVLFITELECFVDSSARGPAIGCRYLGEL